jgi:hypothetical protein
MDNLGKILIVFGAVILMAGIVVTVAGRVPFLSHLGRLPGDIRLQRGSTTIYVPIVTCLLLSILLSLILKLIQRR